MPPKKTSSSVDDDDFDDYDNDGYDDDDSEVLNAALEEFYDAMEDEHPEIIFKEDEAVTWLRSSNYDIDGAITLALNKSKKSTSTKKPAASKPAAPSSSKQPPSSSSSKPTPTTSKPSTTTTTTTNKQAATKNIPIPASVSAMGKDLCAPPPQASPSSSTSISSSPTPFPTSTDDAIKPFDFTEPSPDDLISEKQRQAFSKKKDGSTNTSSSSSTPSTTEGIKYKQNVKTSAPLPTLSSSSAPSTSSAKSNVVEKMATLKLDVAQHSAGRRKELLESISSSMASSSAGKDHLNLVVVGHVDAGKSTTMGHLLFRLGQVDAKTIAKYERESQKRGKASFHYAWVLDQSETERDKGVTIHVGASHFSTDHHDFTLLDAPGHRDYVPNMIGGAAQADVAILVVDGAPNGFENGFMCDGQTKEHAILVRSMGVVQIIVAINKLDMVQWSEERYDTIVSEMKGFLKQSGYIEKNVTFLPCDGLHGVNLVPPANSDGLPSELKEWYTGPSLAEAVDAFRPADRNIEKSFRMSVVDVVKPAQGLSGALLVSGKIDSGFVAVNDKICVSPMGHVCSVKSIFKSHKDNVEYAIAGDNIDLALVPQNTTLDLLLATLSSRCILCDPAHPIQSSSRIRGQIVVFGGRVPITPGMAITFHAQSLEEPAKIKTLLHLVDKATGQPTKQKPRALVEGHAAVIEVVIDRGVCLEKFADYRGLGRFLLRDHGKTIAAGVVLELL
eukprot:TRINITY_DN7051_c0_g1_i1.p1 TRINITY_DN7051_c0_g1~~TRINITY_DN7051_c0_g1_i1.p1  ORF type:complete len:728 (-),score=285.13 TRINITY_DN7051_c0_g1_i1:33-2216(-)